VNCSRYLSNDRTVSRFTINPNNTNERFLFSSSGTVVFLDRKSTIPHFGNSARIEGSDHREQTRAEFHLRRNEEFFLNLPE